MGRGAKITARAHSDIVARLKSGQTVDYIVEHTGYGRHSVFQINLSLDAILERESHKKHCILCGEEYGWERGIKRSVFEKRRFCSRGCANDWRRLGKPPILADEVAPFLSIPEASKELLKRLVIYGLRNDGLPGLPANDLLRLAGELEVAA